MRTCPYCQATTRQNKAGKTHMGVQLYRCMHCNQTYALGPESDSNKVKVSEQKIAMDMHAPVPLAPVFATNSVQELKPARISGEAPVVPPAVTSFPAKKKRVSFFRLKGWAGTANSWGWLPELAVLQSAGLLFLAWTFGRARAMAGSSEPLLWISLALLILPVAFRLASVQPSRRERIGLVLLLGMSLYLVKVMHSPLAFTFPDEKQHNLDLPEITYAGSEH